MPEVVELITEPEAAKRLGIPAGRLRHWRLYSRRHLPVRDFYRLPSGAIRYDARDIDRAVKQSRVTAR